MAIHNEILVGRFNRALEKFLSMKGPPPAPQLASEIMAVLSFFWGAEMRYLESWQRYGLVVNIAAGGAGFNSAARIRVPVASNVIVVMEKIWMFSATASQPRLSITTTAADLANLAVTTGSRFDARGNQAPSAVVSSQNNAAFSLAIQQWEDNFPAAGKAEDIITTDIQEFPVAPGDALTLWDNNANDAMNLVFWWRERQLEESERT